MKSFTKRVRVEDGIYEFVFHRIYTVKGTGFYVCVADQNKRSHFFNMEQSPEGWRIINAPMVPRWIMNVEQELSNAILEELS